MNDQSLVMARPWAQASTGNTFFPDEPITSSIDLHDIGYALSRICRYNGHIRPDWPEAAYSVAQHSLIVYDYVCSKTIDRRVRRAALLHDACEAYVGDIIRPMKPFLPEHKVIERRWARAIELRFDTTLLPMPDLVREADQRVMLDEKRDVMAPNSPRWDLEDHYEPLGVSIEPMPMLLIRARFFAACVQEGLTL